MARYEQANTKDRLVGELCRTNPPYNALVWPEVAFYGTLFAG